MDEQFIRQLQTQVREMKAEQQESVERMRKTYTSYDGNLTDYQEKLQQIADEMKQRVISDQVQMGKAFTEYERRIHQVHEDIVSAFENFYQWMLNDIYDDNMKYVALFFDKIRSSKNRDHYADLVKQFMFQMNHLKKTEKYVNNVHLEVKVSKDDRQYIYGKQPLYFEFDL